MRHHGWMKYLENYDFTLHYHLGKANVVADALNRKSLGVLAGISSPRVVDARGYKTVRPAKQ